jgi:hypothetical protein
LTYRTANLQSCILYIYSTNIGTEYFKHGVYSPFFSSECSLFHNSNIFGSCIFHILCTGCAKIKKNNSGAKRLNMVYTVRFFLFKMQFVHNCNVFGSCIFHILCTGCAKIKKIIPAPKGKTWHILFVFSSSKCSLFHNSNVFGSCIIHILYTGCAKTSKKIIPAPKG